MSEYKKIDANDIAKFVEITDKERVLTGSDINEEYTHDELSSEKVSPDVVVRVTSTQEVSALMKYAYENNRARRCSSRRRRRTHDRHDAHEQDSRA